MASIGVAEKGKNDPLDKPLLGSRTVSNRDPGILDIPSLVPNLSALPYKPNESTCDLHKVLYVCEDS